ncbi:hypothetical protein [Candidatus Nitrososphaera evergladensis]|uniref:hypothetical protein n=1 Tax=Candidatus Nitrososphaera evergladensis TaxID=1459637 RepID=UPI00130E43AA|nr:hypothetical protein [Candidatus Nitrososphaera evergladensis]
MKKAQARQQASSSPQRKECALCGTTLPVGSEVSICGECMKCADCCVGLESLRD